MSITLPNISLPPTPKALVDIIRLEAGPAALPLSKGLAAICLVAYGVGQFGLQLYDHEVGPAAVYGVASVVILTVVTALILLVVGARERFVQTLTALAAMGAIVALVTVVLHLFVSQVFPPPLPTSKLVGFVLFPLIVWNVTLFTFVYRHASLRFIPALSVAACYVGIMTFIVAPLIVRISERL